jgi:hypothetical protein
MSDLRVPSFAPRCPNHDCELEDLPFPLTPKGTGICPSSGCPFEFEVELDEEKEVMDKFGNITKQVSWKVSGEE